MMKWTLALLGVFLLQEPISSNAVLLEAYQHGYNIWLIHLIFVVATLFDIVVGYFIGNFIRKRYAHGRLAQYIERKMKIFSEKTGKAGQRIALMIYGPLIFPISALVAPWLGIGFWDALVFMFIGDLLLWYVFLWIVVLGVKTVIPDPADALYVILGISLVFVIGRTYFKNKNKVV
jgi:membrane protein YqaA with SNARE-associated domain